MYFQFRRKKPFQKFDYIISDKNKTIIGQGHLDDFTKERSVYSAQVDSMSCQVTVFNKRYRPTKTENESEYVCDAAVFVFADGVEHELKWFLRKNGEKDFLGDFQTCNSWQVEVDSDLYEMYRIGLGGKGYYIQVRKNGVVIASVDKEIWVKNYCDVYHAYLLQEKDACIVVALLAYIDLAFHNHYGEHGSNLARTTLKTKDQTTLAKYDPDFIPRMRKQEGM